MLIEAILVIVVGIAWSLLTALVLIPWAVDHRVVPNIKAMMTRCYKDPEWLEDTLGASWDAMSERMSPRIGKSILSSLNGSAMRDIRTISENVPAIENEILARLPQEIPPAEALKMLKVFAKKPGLADTMQDLIEGMAMLQGMGLVGQDQGGNGGQAPEWNPFQN